MKTKTLNLKNAVKRAGYTQAGFAQKMNVTVQAVNNWVARGQVPADRAPRAERLLGVDRRLLCSYFPWGE